MPGLFRSLVTGAPTKPADGYFLPAGFAEGTGFNATTAPSSAGARSAARPLAARFIAKHFPVIDAPAEIRPELAAAGAGGAAKELTAAALRSLLRAKPPAPSEPTRVHVELLECKLPLSVLQVRDTQIVRRKSAETLRVLQPPQDDERLDGLAQCKVDICPEELDVVADTLRHPAIDAVEGAQGTVHLSFLEVDTGKPVGSVVAYLFVDSAFEDRTDRASCPMMHAVAEFEIAERKFRVVDVGVKRVEFRFVDVRVLPDLGIQTFQCLEVVTLVRIVQCFAEIEIFQLFAEALTRCQEQ